MCYPHKNLENTPIIIKLHEQLGIWESTISWSDSINMLGAELFQKNLKDCVVDSPIVKSGISTSSAAAVCRLSPVPATQYKLAATVRIRPHTPPEGFLWSLPHRSCTPTGSCTTYLVRSKKCNNWCDSYCDVFSTHQGSLTFKS